MTNLDQLIYQPIVSTPEYAVAVRVPISFDEWDSLGFEPLALDFSEFLYTETPYTESWPDSVGDCHFGCLIDAELPSPMSEVLDDLRGGEMFPGSVVDGCARPGLFTAAELLDLTLRAPRSSVSTFFYEARDAADAIAQIREGGTYGDAEFREAQLWTLADSGAPTPAYRELRTQPRRLSKRQRRAA